MAFGNASFDEILSTTISNYANKLVDNVFSARALLFWLKRGDRIDRLSGGDKIVRQVLAGQNSTFGAVGEWDTLDLTPQEGITAAVFDWKILAATTIISELEESKNSGPEAIIDLMKAKVFQTEESYAEGLDAMLLADGAVATGAFESLEHLIGDASSTGASDVGGIDATSADNTWWRSYVDRVAEVLTLEKMNNVFNSASVGNDHPDFLLGSQALYEKYESLLQPQQRFSSNALADGGFENLTYKGKPFTYDDYVEADDIYFLNSKYLRLSVHKDKWMKPTKFVTPPDQMFRTSRIVTHGNLTISNRARQGKLEGKTA